MILYHYTSEENSYSIISSGGRLLPSNPWTTMDSAYGMGHYFTDLDNSNCESWLAHVCWQATVFERLRYFFKYNVADWLPTPCRDNVFMVTNWDSVNIKLITHGKNNFCNKRPHKDCNNYKKYF